MSDGNGGRSAKATLVVTAGLVVVLVVVGVVTSIVGDATDDAQRRTCRVEFDTLELALAEMQADSGAYPASLDEISDDLLFALSDDRLNSAVTATMSSRWVYEQRDVGYRLEPQGACEGFDEAG